MCATDCILGNAPSLAHTQTLEKEVAKLDSEMSELTSKWNQEKAVLERVTERQLELEKARARLDEAQRMGEWSKAGELMHSTIPKLQHELEAAEKVCEATGGSREVAPWGRVLTVPWCRHSGQRRHQHARQRCDSRHHRGGCGGVDRHPG